VLKKQQLGYNGISRGIGYRARKKNNPFFQKAGINIISPFPKLRFFYDGGY
jgi:hypothetical protein